MKKKKKENFNRYYSFIICMILIFSMIISKLVYLQIFKGEFYRDRANNNTRKMILKASPRGIIYDKSGKILATNRQSFMLTFSKTNESEKSFYKTMDKVFALLKENGEVQDDDFQLKVNPYEFQFNVSSEGARQWNENRFKKDRGLDDEVISKLYKKKKKDELSETENKIVEEKIKNITPEYTFKYLIKKYSLYDLIKENYLKEKWDNLKDKDEKLKDTWIKNEEKQWNNMKKDIKDKTVNYLLSKKDLKTIRQYMIIKDTIQMQSGYKPIVIASDLKENSAFIFEQLQSELPGISVINQPIREYPNKDLASNILGYIRKVNPDEKNKYEEKGYDVSTDYIGADGIEGIYENILRGTKGEESIETNKYGRKVKTLGEQVSSPGKNIQLTIDADIQKAAERALDDTMNTLKKNKDRKADGSKNDVNTANATRGAAVVTDVKTGKILAIVSRPGYDPNLFTLPGKLSDADYKKFFSPDLGTFGREYIEERGLLGLEEFNGEKLTGMNSKEKEDFLLKKLFPLSLGIKGNTTLREDVYDIYPKPFYNYASKSLIPPGSTFKPVTSVAGLEEGVITKDTPITDTGYYNKRYKDFKGASWKFNTRQGTHGTQNLMEALRDSNNFYMFDIADKLFEKGGVEKKSGLNMIAKYAWMFGLGADPSLNPKYSTGLEIDENFGQVYHYDRGKNNLSVLYRYNLYDYLKKGTASIWGINYKGIDIVPKNEEDINIKKLKEQLKSMINEQITANNKNSNFDKAIEVVLRDLINVSGELKKNNYTDKDIQGMILSINSSINDARTEIKSGTNLYNASIGQGLNQFTPVQLANYVATLVNGGNRYKVHLVDKITDVDGKIIKDYSKTPELLGKANISKNTVEAVKEGMREVTLEGGTAASVFNNFPITNGGKTGSATFSNAQEQMGRTSYGLYVGFAPYENPEISVAVVIFDGGHGGSVAPVAKAIFEEYFKNEIIKVRPNYDFMYKENKQNLQKQQNVNANVKDNVQKSILSNGNNENTKSSQDNIPNNTNNTNNTNNKTPNNESILNEQKKDNKSKTNKVVTD